MTNAQKQQLAMVEVLTIANSLLVSAITADIHNTTFDSSAALRAAADDVDRVRTAIAAATPVK